MSKDDKPAQGLFCIGDAVRHRRFGFRGVIFDVDPVYANTEEWWESIPQEMRPSKDQPFYHLLAENSDHTPYVAYVSEQNLERLSGLGDFDHPGLEQLFDVNRQSETLHYKGIKH